MGVEHCLISLSPRCFLARSRENRAPKDLVARAANLGGVPTCAQYAPRFIISNFAVTRFDVHSISEQFAVVSVTIRRSCSLLFEVI
jgi:hypothetical protein